MTKTEALFQTILIRIPGFGFSDFGIIWRRVVADFGSTLVPVVWRK
jgi:hypothetical protein